MDRRHPLHVVLVGLAAVLAVTAARCGDDDSGAAADRATTSTAPSGGGGGSTTVATQDGTASVAVGNSDVGEVLVDGQGQVLYAYTPDDQGTPTCVDACARAWPPLLTEGGATPGAGAEGSLLGTVGRDDGRAQVTYDGWPLYRFAGDDQPGTAAGQGSGGVWFVLDAQGDLVRSASGADGGY